MPDVQRPQSRPDVVLIQEALEYQEEHSLEGPLFPEAQEELQRLVEQYEGACRDRDRHRRAAEILERERSELQVERHGLREQLEALREAVAIAIEDVLLMDSPEGDSPRNIAGNLRDALNSNSATKP